jgi:predicted ribosomally synthesized peptide with SipW-like signal peptide
MTASTLVMVLVATLSMTASSTLSYFHDSESSTQNAMHAEALDFTASPDSETNFTFTDGTLSEIDGALMTLVAPEEGSSPLRYTVRGEYISGNLTFCDAIYVTVTDPFNYYGMITGLIGSNVDLDTSLTLLLELEEGEHLSGDTCVVDIVYEGWNEEQSEEMGYDDEERVRLTFTNIITTPTTALSELPPFELFEEGEEVLVDVSTTTEVEGDEEVEHVPPGQTRDDTEHQNNGHGNDNDNNDDSNPGESNREDDTTDAEVPLDIPEETQEADLTTDTSDVDEESEQEEEEIKGDREEDQELESESESEPTPAPEVV